VDETDEWRREPGAYEEEVLTALKSLVRGAADRRERDGIIVRDVRLEGTYPETRIVVVFDDLREPPLLRQKRGYELWWENGPAHPGIAASQIDIAIEEE
jgi:hypothetical protein